MSSTTESVPYINQFLHFSAIYNSVCLSTDFWPARLVFRRYRYSQPKLSSDSIQIKCIIYIIISILLPKGSVYPTQNWISPIFLFRPFFFHSSVVVSYSPLLDKYAL